MHTYSVMSEEYTSGISFVYAHHWVVPGQVGAVVLFLSSLAPSTTTEQWERKRETCIGKHGCGGFICYIISHCAPSFVCQFCPTNIYTHKAPTFSPIFFQMFSSFPAYYLTPNFHLSPISLPAYPSVPNVITMLASTYICTLLSAVVQLQGAVHM